MPVGTPALWAVSITVVLVLVALDFLLTRRPHEVSMREAVGWSIFYVALPLVFGAWIWNAYGGQRGLEFITGYLVEKSLSVDNLFVFMILLTSFAVPPALRQRVLLFGIVGALVLRGVFIALGAQLVANFTWAFLLFGGILLLTAVKVLRDALSPAEHDIDVSQLRTVRLVRRFWPVTDTYDGTRLSVVRDGRRHLTPMALVIVAILGTDVVFAVDSVPAVYGITDDPYLVFATNAFALLGFGLAAILAFIGVKLVLHWAHTVWVWIPEVPTVASLGVIVSILALVVATSLVATRRRPLDASL